MNQPSHSPNSTRKASASASRSCACPRRCAAATSSGGSALAAGEILVTPYTDPGWTPLFINAAGLIMEVGGRLTHGSVVAREYGIPAVVGVRGATQRLHTGQRVCVDGNHGVIEVM